VHCHRNSDTTFGNDVTIEPFVVIGPGVTIADGAVIHSFSHIVQASIGKKASVGPYARLRPGTSLGLRPNHRYHSGRPPRQEGRIAIVTDAGLDAVDAAASGAIVVAGRVLP
jgi:UDP-3-O-[3-hydroxymyristoyl] glucosamine N-acyltransferase